MDLPPIRYTHARDGTRIAYTVIPGTSPPWLHLYSLGAPTIELDTSIGARRGYIQNLARGRATVLFDHRGSGFSGPICGELTLDDLVDDVAAVTEAVGEPMDVSVMGTGCLVAFRYAAMGAPGWRSLLLHGGIVLRYAGSRQDRAQAIWRDGSYTHFLEAAARVSMDVTAEETEVLVRRWAELVPEDSAAAYVKAVVDLDLKEDACQVSLPTLITSSPRNKGAAEAAALIRGAVFAPLDLLVNRPELGTEVRDLWDRHIAPLLRGSAADRPGPEALGHIAARLSDRERDILRLVAAGQSNVEIAERLTLSTRTIERHVQNIYNKLGVHNRVEAANWAREHGVV